MSSKKGKPHQDGCDAGKKKADGTSYNNLMLELHSNPYKFQYKSFGQTKELSITQDFEFGIGGVLWDCGLVLARYVTMAENQGRWMGKVVVELGAGTGLPALSCWQMGAKAIITDLEEVAVPITAPNILANTVNAKKELRRNCIPFTVSWGEDGDVEKLMQCPLIKENKGVIDFIIAADVVYRGEDHPKLLHTIDKLWGPSTTIIFVHRSRVSNDGNFVEPLKASYIETKSTPAKVALPSYPKDNATIYEFNGRRAVPLKLEGYDDGETAVTGE